MSEISLKYINKNYCNLPNESILVQAGIDLDSVTNILSNISLVTDQSLFSSMIYEQILVLFMIVFIFTLKGPTLVITLVTTSIMLVVSIIVRNLRVQNNRRIIDIYLNNQVNSKQNNLMFYTDSFCYVKAKKIFNNGKDPRLMMLNPIINQDMENSKDNIIEGSRGDNQMETGKSFQLVIERIVRFSDGKFNESCEEIITEKEKKIVGAFKKWHEENFSGKYTYLHLGSLILLIVVTFILISLVPEDNTKDSLSNMMNEKEDNEVTEISSVISAEIMFMENTSLAESNNSNASHFTAKYEIRKRDVLLVLVLSFFILIGTIINLVFKYLQSSRIKDLFINNNKQAFSTNGGYYIDINYFAAYLCKIELQNSRDINYQYNRIKALFNNEDTNYRAN